MSSPPWAGSICRGLSQCQQPMLVLGENLVKGQAAFFGVDVACELQSHGSACSPEQNTRALNQLWAGEL